MVEQTGRGIVGHVQIEASVLVVVQPEHSQPVVAVGIDVQFLGYIGEGAVAVVVIQAVAAALESARAAGHRNAAIGAEGALPELGEMVEIKVHVVGHVEVEIAVIVVVAKGRAGAPASGVSYSGFLGDIGERSVVVVVVERRRRRDK